MTLVCTVCSDTNSKRWVIYCSDWFYVPQHILPPNRDKILSAIFHLKEIFGEWWIVTSLADSNTFDYAGNFPVDLEIRWLLRNHFFTSLHSTYDTRCFHFHFHFQDQSSIDCMFVIRIYEQLWTVYNKIDHCPMIKKLNSFP